MTYKNIGKALKEWYCAGTVISEALYLSNFNISNSESNIVQMWLHNDDVMKMKQQLKTSYHWLVPCKATFYKIHKLLIIHHHWSTTIF